MNARELTALGKSQGYVVEALTGIATLKAAGAEQRSTWTMDEPFLRANEYLGTQKPGLLDH